MSVDDILMLLSPHCPHQHASLLSVVLHQLYKTENPIESYGYNQEITSLIQELKLDFAMNTPPTPSKVDMRDMAHHLARNTERLQSEILIEIENSRSPMPPSVSRDLTDRFDNTSKTYTPLS